MTVKYINPDSTMLQQSEGMWMKYLSLVLAKLAPNGVIVTQSDIEAVAASKPLTVLVYGHADSIELKLVTEEEAHRISKYERTQRGKA